MSWLIFGITVCGKRSTITCADPERFMIAYGNEQALHDLIALIAASPFLRCS